MDTLLVAVFIAAARIPKIRIAPIDEDIPLVEERDELVNHAVYGLSCHDHKHDFTGPFEGRYEILQAVIGGNMIVGPFFDKFFRQIRCIVIDADRKSMICHIEGQIAAHDSHSDNADIM